VTYVKQLRLSLY